MEVKVASTCLHWSQPIAPYSTPSSQALVSSISSPSSKRRNRGGSGRDGRDVLCLYVNSLNRSALFGTPTTKLHRSKSSEYHHQKPRFRSIKRASSASPDAFSDEEFSKKIQELALRFQLSDDLDDVAGDEIAAGSEPEAGSSDSDSRIGNGSCSSMRLEQNQSRFHLPLDLEPPWPSSDWPRREESVHDPSIERKANSVDLPLSLRMIKRKIRWQEGFREAGESACCSVRRAFSSMVFIIRELHSYTLQMREVLFYEDLQGILSRVQQEMNASFVWLFQQVFSQTPTLMVYVMILMANFTVYSLGHNAAIAASPPPGYYSGTTESVSVEEVLNLDDQLDKNPQFDSSTSKTFSVNGKTASVGGNNGGGGKVRPVGSGTDGDGRFDGSDQYRTIVPDGASQLSSSLWTTGETESLSGQEIREEEVVLWNSVVEDAHRMSGRDEALDHETVGRFIAPVTADMEADNYEEYFRTEILYQSGLSREPSNALLLANYAQFLYQVAHDYDRAEDFFKKAIAVDPPDAEAYNKYATFLWRVRNDLWAAEETFLEAISADPSNSYYAANYAHFLWNTGGEDTCFPLTSSEVDTTAEEA